MCKQGKTCRFIVMLLFISLILFIPALAEASAFNFSDLDFYGGTSEENCIFDDDGGVRNFQSSPTTDIYALIKNTEGTDYTATFNVQYLTEWNSVCSGFGIFYRAHALNDEIVNGYSFQFDPGLGDRFVVYNFSDTDTTVIQSIGFYDAMGSDFDRFALHTYELSLQENHHVIKCDGVTIFDFTDDSWSSGRLGIRAWGYATSKFYNYEQKKLNDDDLLIPTSTVLTTSDTPSTYGDAVIFTATVNPLEATGMIDFFDGEVPLGTVAISGGSASITSVDLTAGTHTIKAVYTGEEDIFKGSDSFCMQTIEKKTPLIIWDNPADIVLGTVLNGTHLNATTSIPGEFIYLPPVGTVLEGGTHILNVLFTPSDTNNYAAATKYATINVISIEEQIETLIANIDDLNMSSGNKSSLIKKLENASKNYEKDKISSINILGAFINEVNALSNKISDGKANELISATNNIIFSINTLGE